MLVFLIFKEALINVLRFLCKIWFKNGSEKAQITFYFRAIATAPFFFALVSTTAPLAWTEKGKSGASAQHCYTSMSFNPTCPGWNKKFFSTGGSWYKMVCDHLSRLYIYVRYSTVLFCGIQYCTVLWDTQLCCSVGYSTVLFCEIGFKDFIQFLYSLCATPQTVGAAATISCGAVNN